MKTESPSNLIEYLIVNGVDESEAWQVRDKLFEYLRGLGYTGAVEDMLYEHLSSTPGALEDKLFTNKPFDIVYSYIMDVFSSNSTLTTTGGDLLTVKDYAGNLVSVQPNTPAIEGGYYATTVAEGAELGPELVTNGGFDDTSWWIRGTGWSIVNGEAVGENCSYSKLSTPAVLEVGKRYIVTGELKENTTSNMTTYGLGTQFVSGTGPFSIEGVATSTNFNFEGGPATSRRVLDNISIREVIPTWLPHLSDGTQLHPYKTVRDRQGTKRLYQYYPLRKDSTAYTAGDKVSLEATDCLGLWAEAQSTGTTAATPPVVSTADIGQTVTDGSVQWLIRGYHTLKGLSNWAGATNLIIDSEDFTTSSWFRMHTTVASNVLVAPDGNSMADRVNAIDITDTQV
ncbi:MAG: hypothetical protein D6706_20520, partial [Chloroflexi bacterium]